MPDYLILCPTEIEATPIRRRVSGVRVEICGVGMAETAATAARLAAAGDAGFMILAGIGGAYAWGGLAVPDVVLVSEERIADLGSFRGGEFTGLFQKSYECPHLARFEGVKAAKGCTVNAGGAQFVAGAAVENMEGAAFFAVCLALGVPFAEVRAISNIVGAPRNSWRIDEAAEALAGFLEKIVRS